MAQPKVATENVPCPLRRQRAQCVLDRKRSLAVADDARDPVRVLEHAMKVVGGGAAVLEHGRSVRRPRLMR
jgi:hypothetical protein